MKKNLILTYLLVLVVMSSCGVYSLFPIYTTDTIVEKKEVVGKWLSDDSKEEYIEFSKVSYSIMDNAVVSNSSGKVENLSISFSSEDPDDDVVDTGTYVIEDGDTTIFKDTLLADFEDALGKKFSKLGRLESGDKEDLFYLMTVYEKGESTASFKAHFVKIGNELFVDLYPVDGLDTKSGASDNYFPVHTFMKVKVSEKQFSLTAFDQGKLKDLFKSNLIRMRHEIVEDRVLITAQPKEIQKFLEKYSKDETVFEGTATYTKVNS